MADDDSHGCPPFEEWSSENYAVSINPEGVTLRNEWVEGEKAETRWPSSGRRWRRTGASSPVCRRIRTWFESAVLTCPSGRRAC